jgi:DNA-binding MurR/RpiR family transcriptional regulator
VTITANSQGPGDATEPPGLSEIDRAIAANYDKLSAGQRLAIDRLLADTRYGAVVSAPQLAEAVGISESTITRAAQTLGFAGFPDLQRHLRARFVAPVQERIAPIAEGGDATLPLAVRVMLDDAAHIREMAEDISPEAVAAVADLLVGARRVIVYGERGSYGLALMLSMGLRLVLDDARLLTQAAGDLPDQLIGIEPADVVVAVSFRRIDQRTVKVMRHARSHGAKVVALTDHRSGPAARAADLSLIARTGTLRLMPSFAPGASLVNALLEEVAARTRHQAADRLREAETLWNEFGSYAED